MQAGNMDLNLLNTAATSVGTTSQFMEDTLHIYTEVKQQKQQRAETHDINDKCEQNEQNDVIDDLIDKANSLTNGDYDKDRIERDLAESRRELPEQYDNFHADNVETTDHMLEYQTDAEAETLNLLLPELQETNALDCSNFSMDVDDFNTCLNNMFCNDVDDVVAGISAHDIMPVTNLVNVPTLGQTKQTIAQELPIVVMHNNNNNNNNNIGNDGGFSRDTNSTEMAIPITLQNIPDTKQKIITNNVIDNAYLEDIVDFCADANSNDSNSVSDDSSRHSSKSSISCNSSSISSCGNYNRATFTVAARTTSTTSTSSNIVTRNDAADNNNEIIDCRKHNVLNIFQ